MHVNIGGGPTFILGDLGDHFSTGWGPAIGVTFDVKPRIRVQFEYAYRYFSLNDDGVLPVGATALAPTTRRSSSTSTSWRT